MTDYLLCKTDEIPEGKGRAFQAGQRTIAVVRANGKFYAMANKCMHRGASMCEGVIADGGATIRCPWHNWTFDLETGRNVEYRFSSSEQVDVIDSQPLDDLTGDIELPPSPIGGFTVAAGGPTARGYPPARPC